MYDIPTITLILYFIFIITTSILVSLFRFKEQQLKWFKSRGEELRKEFYCEESDKLKAMEKDFMSPEAQKIEARIKLLDKIEKMYESWVQNYFSQKYKYPIHNNIGPKKQVIDFTKGIATAVLCIFVACFIWYKLTGNPFYDYSLDIQSKTTQGFIINTWEEPPEKREGKMNWTHGFTYLYTTPDGQRHKGDNLVQNGRLTDYLRPPLKKPYPVLIEYLPNKPEVSRIAKKNKVKFSNWFFRKIVLGSLLLIGFLLPGIIIFRNTILEFSNVKYYLEIAEKGFLQ